MTFSSVHAFRVAAYTLRFSIVNLQGIFLIYVFVLLEVLGFPVFLKNIIWVSANPCEVDN